jgi:hypothetical protein
LHEPEVNVEPLQLAPHVVVGPGKTHAAAFVPLHAPAHALPPSSCSPAHAARAPCGAPVTVVHVPIWPATSHAWHCCGHAALQQTPSTQKPLAQLPFASHEVPLAALVPHVPRLQVAGGAQSVLVAHVVTQLPSLHA